MTTRLLRGEEHRVTNIELFFDLVYVFAVTQLSHGLLSHPTAEGALRTALLLAMVWLAWAYTTWVTNWLDPDRIPTRLMLAGLMLVGLVMSAGLPEAFSSHGLAIGASYAIMQIGRSAYAAVALRGSPLGRNFTRILIWCVVSGALAVVGGLVHGHAREACWLLVVVIDLFGSVVGFWTPVLGRSRTSEWTIDGGHFAERCQAFILIALGESIVVTGSTFSEFEGHAATITAFVSAFAGAVALWWLYFDRSAEEGARIIAASDDPGRLGRSAYHGVHPIMIAGIIVTAAADEELLAHPTEVGDAAAVWMLLGGTALFLAGHALFKLVVWHVLPATRLIAIAVIGLLGFLAPHVSLLTLALCTCVIVIVLAASDRLLNPGLELRGPAEPTEQPAVGRLQ